MNYTKQATYKTTLERCLDGGLVTPDEAAIAETLRVSLGVGEQDHQCILEELGYSLKQWEALKTKGAAPPTALPVKASPKGDRWALLIANSEYTHGQTVLTNPDVDVELITASLLEVRACVRGRAGVPECE